MYHFQKRVQRYYFFLKYAREKSKSTFFYLITGEAALQEETETLLLGIGLAGTDEGAEIAEIDILVDCGECLPDGAGG